MMLSEIHPFLIEKYKQKRLSEGAKVAVNRELSRLRTLFNLCLQWRKFEGANPASRYQRAPESKGRIRFLTEAEEKQLLEKATEPLRSVIIIGIHTGLRAYSEALSLTKPNVDLLRKSVTVEDHFEKNGATRTVPLNSVALETLKRIMAMVPGPQVFMTRGRDKNGEWRPYMSFRTAFETAVRNAKLSGVTPHVLRHTFASRLVMRGADLRTVQELGGWKSLNMVQRYAHLSQEHKQQAIELLAENFPSFITTPVEKVFGLKAVS
jgi:integrase